MTTKNANIIKRFKFESDTQPGKKYETILWSDLSTSCQCFGWCRRVLPDGSRECKHTKRVKQLHPEARSRTEPYRTQQVSVSVPANTPVTITATHGAKVTVSAKPANSTGRRKFRFEDA